MGITVKDIAIAVIERSPWEVCDFMKCSLPEYYSLKTVPSKLLDCIMSKAEELGIEDSYQYLISKTIY